MTEEQEKQQLGEHVSNLTQAAIQYLEQNDIKPHVGSTVAALVLISSLIKGMMKNPNDEEEDVNLMAVEIAAIDLLRVILRDMRQYEDEPSDSLAS